MDSQTPAWFFREGFDANGAYVDVATWNFVYRVYESVLDILRKISGYSMLRCM
jgi:hypothetical protein